MWELIGIWDPNEFGSILHEAHFLELISAVILSKANLSNMINAKESTLRPTMCKVNLAALGRNYESLSRHVEGSVVMPVIKANAYGHGIREVGMYFQKIGAKRLAVAYVEEGIMLREAGVTIPIHVMGGAMVRQIPLFLEHDLILTAPSLEKLLQINETARDMNKKAVVHLKIDTGMGRIGVHHDDTEEFLEESLRCESIIIEGIFSHFARADEEDLAPALLQLERFLKVLEFYPRKGLPYPLRHIANSAAIAQMPQARFDIVRPGIIMYGVYPSPETKKTVVVEPALQWCSEVGFIKQIEAGTPVSYGARWHAKERTTVVTLPVGYADGYSRYFTNNAEVLIRGQRFPVAGTVCMDQTVVDMKTAAVGTVYNGDIAVLIGRDGEHIITAEDLAMWAGTIGYEILTSISARVPRVYVEH